MREHLSHLGLGNCDWLHCVSKALAQRKILVRVRDLSPRACQGSVPPSPLLAFIQAVSGSPRTW